MTAQEVRRPIIFIAHSLGGIVVKQVSLYSITYSCSNKLSPLLIAAIQN
jgi:predicted alpha/beta hydrolase family esterase